MQDCSSRWPRPSTRWHRASRYSVLVCWCSARVVSVGTSVLRKLRRNDWWIRHLLRVSRVRWGWQISCPRRSLPRAGQRWCRRGREHGFWRRYPCRSWLPSPACLHRIAGSWWICCVGSGSEPSVLLRIYRQWTSLRVSVPMRCSRIVRRAVNPNGHRRRGHFRRTWRWSSITIRRSSGWMPQRLPGAPWRVSCTTSCLLPRWRAPVCRFRPARVTVKIFLGLGVAPNL